jgi:ribosomal protein L37AE/L43A
METKPVREPFQCKKCNYVTSRKSSYDRHNLSRKHNVSETETKVRAPMSCMKCEKEFKSRSGIWKHDKECKVTKPQSLEKAIEVTAELTHVIVKQQEEKEILINQIKQQQKQLNELIPRIGNVINIQVFLNETCKDAVNWNDFIKSLPQSTNITKTICDGIEELGMYKRPVHCFEEKQLCIKHENVWEHDMNKINATMVQTNDVMKQQWERDHPQWYTNAKETEEYTHLFQKEIKPDNLTTFTV